MRRWGELAERGPQLAALESCWSTVTAQQRGQVVVVGGEAGGGKTALVEAFTAGITPGARVLVGAADVLHTARPLGPFRDIARPDGDAAQAIERSARPFEVASALLAELTSTGPVVVVLEDLHWADEASLDVLRLLARRLREHPVLVIVTYRDDEVGRSHPLRLALGELSGSLQRIRVPALSAQAVATLACQHGGEVDGAELYRKTAGNAFFVTEVLAAASEQIPDSVRDAVLARVARLDADSRAVAEVVAVVPQLAELDLIEQVAPGSGEALDACIAAGVLHVSGDGLAFRHELARLAVEDALPPTKRRALHRLVVKALETDGCADAARLAHHADAAGDMQAVVTHAPAAAEQAAAVGAHREAARQWARVLRYEAQLEDAERARVLAAHSRECYLADDGVAAVESAKAAVRLHDKIGAARPKADALLWLATVYLILGGASEAAETINAALRLLDREPADRETARAYAAVAQAAMIAGDAGATFAAAERALQIAERLDDVETRIHVMITAGTMEMEFAPTAVAGREKLVRSVALAKQAGLHDMVGRAYNNLVYEAFAARELDLAEQCAREAVAFGRASGVDVWLNIALGSLAEVEMVRGRWDDAVETAAQVLRRGTAGFPRMGPLTLIGTVRARRGDPDPWEPLDEALDIAHGSGDLQSMAPVATARAEAAWLEGRNDRVLAETDAVFARAITAGHLWALPDLAYWRRQAGALDDIPALPDSPRALQLAGSYEEAAAQWTELGYPYEAALALACGGDEDGLRRSLAALQSLGASAAAAIVARRLRDLGASSIPRGPRPSTAANPALLTRREVQIASLLAEGLPNAEIASRLFLSEKTVGNHVSSVLRKLGVTARAQVGAEVKRLGLIDAGPV